MKIVITDNTCGGGKIQAADSSPDGYGIARIGLSNVEWQSPGLRAENQIIPVVYFSPYIKFRCVSAEGKHISLLISGFQEGFEIAMVPNVDLLPVVQSRPLEMSVINLES